MWAYTAQRHAGNPVVVGYDLMVEPNGNEAYGGLNIFDPEQFYDSYPNSLYDWNQMHPAIATAIRNVDATTPIIVGAMSYSAVEWLPCLLRMGTHGPSTQSTSTRPSRIPTRIRATDSLQLVIARSPRRSNLVSHKGPLRRTGTRLPRRSRTRSS